MSLALVATRTARGTQGHHDVTLVPYGCGNGGDTPRLKMALALVHLGLKIQITCGSNQTGMDCCETKNFFPSPVLPAVRKTRWSESKGAASPLWSGQRGVEGD